MRDQPWASPRVPHWKETALGWHCDWGVLRVALFQDMSGWTIFFYLRPGVQIGIVRSEHRLCKTNTPGALHVEAAKAWALQEADVWLSTENVDRIAKFLRRDLPPSSDPARTLLSYNPQGNA